VQLHAAVLHARHVRVLKCCIVVALLLHCCCIPTAAPWLQIYLVAGNALPTYTGLAPQCANFAQAAAVAAAEAAPDASCPAAPQLACAQGQLRPDTQTLQSGGVLLWPANTSSSDPIVWQQPAGVSVYGRPAKAQLSLEGGAAPAFTFGPAFTPALRTGSSFGMDFALDKPALLIYAGKLTCVLRGLARVAQLEWSAARAWGSCSANPACLLSVLNRLSACLACSLPANANRCQRQPAGPGADCNGARACVRCRRQRHHRRHRRLPLGARRAHAAALSGRVVGGCAAPALCWGP
jgi:hypothetical protein